MGNCASSICDAQRYSLDTTKPLEVDADIVGPGVLASFIISASFAMLAIGLGYFTDSLPRRHLHKLDRVFVRQTRESWLLAKGIPAFRRLFKPVKQSLEKTRLKMLFPHIPREIRCEALIRFLLVNSDQQLVTGLATLTGGLANRCQLSGYEFRIVASLGWFSTTTHLATLSVLTNYFKDHPEVLLLRLTGMGVTLCLLAFAITVSILSTTPIAAPWECTLGNLVTSGDSVFTVFLLMLYLSGAFVTRVLTLVRDARKTREQDHARLKALVNSKSEDKGQDNISSSKNVQIEVSHYDTEHESSYIHSYAKGCLWLYARISGKLPHDSEFDRVLKIALDRAEKRRDLIFDSAMNESKRSWLFYADLLSVDFCNSFVFGYTFLIFAFVFGIEQTIRSRETTKGIQLSSSASEWGFAQIVPLFLLALPLLAGAEIYFESRRKAHSHFYALAIAEGDADEDMKDLERTDTVTPKQYSTFLDSPNVKYSLRLAVLLTIGLLTFAAVGVQTSVLARGVAAFCCVAIIIIFAIYATLREVHLANSGMKKVIAAERSDQENASTRNRNV